MSIPSAWLLGPTMTAEECERANREEWRQKLATLTTEQADLRKSVPDVPFGRLNTAWLSLRAQAQDGDVFQAFSSGRESFKRMAGRAGIALVRNGVPINAIITRMN